MDPHEHLFFALLPVVLYLLLRYRRLPSKATIFVLSIGSQFPDLVDKPLAFSAGILPSGRVFMHSLPFVIPLSIVLVIYGLITDRLYLSTGFVWAHLSHLIGDFRFSLFSGQIPPDLIWPLVSASPSPDIPFWARTTPVTVEVWTTFSILVLSIVAIIVSMDISSQIRRPD